MSRRLHVRRCFFFFSSRRRHTRFDCDWSSDVCSSDLIDDTLYDAFGQRQVSTIFTQLNQYHVILEVAPRFQDNPEALKAIYVKSANGTQVPLSAFTHYVTGSAPLSVNHQGQFPAVTVSFNLAPGVALGHAVNAIKAVEREIGLPLSIRAAFQGTAKAFQASLANEPLLILAALITVYIVLRSEEHTSELQS